MRRSMSDDSLVSSRNSSIQAITVLQQPSEPNYMSLGRPQVSNETHEKISLEQRSTSLNQNSLKESCDVIKSRKASRPHASYFSESQTDLNPLELVPDTFSDLDEDFPLVMDENGLDFDPINYQSSNQSSICGVDTSTNQLSIRRVSSVLSVNNEPVFAAIKSNHQKESQHRRSTSNTTEYVINRTVKDFQVNEDLKEAADIDTQDVERPKEEDQVSKMKEQLMKQLLPDDSLKKITSKIQRPKSYHDHLDRLERNTTKSKSCYDLLRSDEDQLQDHFIKDPQSSKIDSLTAEGVVTSSASTMTSSVRLKRPHDFTIATSKPVVRRNRTRIKRDVSSVFCDRRSTLSDCYATPAAPQTRRSSYYRVKNNPVENGAYTRLIGSVKPNDNRKVKLMNDFVNLRSTSPFYTAPRRRPQSNESRSKTRIRYRSDDVTADDFYHRRTASLSSDIPGSAGGQPISKPFIVYSTKASYV